MSQSWVALCDILYNNNYQGISVKTDDKDDDSDDEDGESDEEDHSSPPVICGNAYDFVRKVRITVIIFRKSPVSSDNVLKLLFIKEHGKELKIIFDCKLRCLNLLAMLLRFLM